jgi:hypothetical protein
MEGWYVGPAKEHYQCFQIWNIDTRHIRIADTLTWFPTKGNMLIPNDKELLTAARNDIANILQRQRNGAPESATQLLDESQLNELQRIKAMLAPTLETYQ